MSFGVVLDACVLIPAAVRDTLLRAAAAGMYRLHWSEDILAEVQRNLVADGLTSAQGAADVVSAMRRAFPEATVEGYQHLVLLIEVDEKDRHVAAAAVVSGTQVIVTLDLNDFPLSVLDQFGIDVRSPDEFLVSLFEMDPDGICQIVRDQARALVNPPRTTADVVNALGRVAPRFASMLRDALEAERC